MKTKRQSAPPEFQAAVTHSKTPGPAADRKAALGKSPTRGKCYGAVYDYAVDVTVPRDWSEREDRAYALEVLDATTADEVLEAIFYWLPSFYGVLTFAFCYLTRTPYEPGESLFHLLPVSTKVGVLQAQFKRRSPSADYMERFDCDLRRFLDVETICLPVLERYYIQPQSVWLRELVDVHDNLVNAMSNFSESLRCEHDDCGSFLTPDRIDPPPPRLCNNGGSK